MYRVNLGKINTKKCLKLVVCYKLLRRQLKIAPKWVLCEAAIVFVET